MHAEDLAKKTRAALLALAKQHSVKGVSRLRKQALVERLVKHLAVLPGSPPAPATTTPSVRLQKPQPTHLLAQLTHPSPQEQPLSLLSPAMVTQDLTEGTLPHPAQPEQEAADSKFFLGPQPTITVSEPATLPASYNDNRLVLLPRDAHWLYAYWDFSAERFSKAQNQLGSPTNSLILRVFDVTYIEFNGANAWSQMDIELTPFATNWYIEVPRADATYCVELGYRSPKEHFVALGRSNEATTPRAEESPSMRVRWFTPPRSPKAALQSPAVVVQEDVSRVSYQSARITLFGSSSENHPFSWGAVRKI